MKQTQQQSTPSLSGAALCGFLLVACGPHDGASGHAKADSNKLILSAAPAQMEPTNISEWGSSFGLQDRQGCRKTKQSSGVARSNTAGRNQGDQGKQTPEQVLLLRSARNAIALGKPAETISLFESYTTQLPTDQEVHVELAGVLVQQGQAARARKMYEASLTAVPESPSTRKSLVNVLIMSGEYTTAADHLEAIVAQDIDDVAAAALLCRTYSWVNDLKRAQAVFDRYLRKLDASNETDQRLLAPVLLDIQKPSQALPLLERLSARFPSELIWATSLVYCHQLLGNGERANKAVNQMITLEPNVLDLRLHLVDQLLSLRNYKLSLQVIEQVLRSNKNHAMARLTAARIQLEAYDVRRARDSLEALKQDLGKERKYSLALAQLHQLSGEWILAQSIYESILVHQPGDDEVRINLALLHREKGDLYKAKAELSKVKADSPYGARASLELASTLIAQGDESMAASLCTKIMDSRPNDVAPVLALTRAQMAMGNFDQATATCQRFIQQHPSDTMAIAQARSALGKSQLLAGNAVQAARTFQMSIAEPSMHDPETYYGLARARARGIGAVGDEIARLSAGVVASGGENRMRIELGKLAQKNHDYTSATTYLSNVLRWQPNNTAALTLLGESQNLALKAGEKVNPVQTFRNILEKHPSNTRARLGLARSYVIRREFKLAIAEYQTIVQQDSGYHFAKREYARALFWDQRLAESFKVYEQLISSLPDGAVAVNFFDSDVSGKAQRALSDFSNDAKFTDSVKLELESKRLLDWKPALASKSLEQLLIVEPTNQEALFDLAQIQHRRGLTDSAISHYETLINTSSGHQEADIAVAGARRDLRPHFDLRTGNESRDGRDGLAKLKEGYVLADITFVNNNREDYFGISLGERTYDHDKPHTNDSTIKANVIQLFGSRHITKRTSIDATAELPTHDKQSPMGKRVYYNAGLNYLSDSEISVDLRLFSQPVAENYETLDRDIHRNGGRLGVSAKLARKADVGGSLMIANYSDNNSRSEANLFAAYEFIAAPTELRVMLKADVQDNSKQDSGAKPLQNLTAEDTPYFSPKGYSVFSVQADWKHQLGDQWFTGSKDMFYQASLRLSADSNGVRYHEFGISTGYDISDSLRFEAGFRLLESDAFDMTTGYALVTVRWP